MKTSKVNQLNITKKWLTVDARGRTLGRLATELAYILRGKHKPSFTPHIDCGDNVIVTNAENIKLTANKLDDKVYYHHSGYIGGIKSKHAAEILEKNPERLISKAVKGMLPKNKLSNQIMKNLRVYAGDAHNHAAQTPSPMPQRLVMNGESK
jgi:large subunit ribosomal protein L13